MAQTFENVRLVIADSNSMVRQGLKAALYSIGFRTVTDTASFVKLHDLIEQDSVDLLITSSELEGHDVNYLVAEMRNQRLGANPFQVVITLLTSADPVYVKRVIDGGSDDLLLTPVQPDQLFLRIEKLTRGRKPFVITHDYTGPDRRAKARAFDTHSAPMLEVPNPLKYRAENAGLDGTRLQRSIVETSITLNRIKIERYAVQIDWLANHIHASIRDGIATDPHILLPYTSKLVMVLEDLLRRMKGTVSEPHSGLVADLLDLAKQVDFDPTKIAYAELERLNEKAKGLSRLLGSFSTAATPAASVKTA